MAVPLRRAFDYYRTRGWFLPNVFPTAVLLGLPNVTPTAQALWAEFAPDAGVADPDSWLMSKLGSPVSPLDVVVNGSHSMHAVDDAGVSCQGYGSRYAWEQLTIRRVPCAEPLKLNVLRQIPDSDCRFESAVS